MGAEMSFDWSDKAVTELKRLFDEGLSMSQIAAAIGAPSRNSVIGKLHRNGMFRGKPKPVPRPPRVQRKGVHTAKAWKPRKPTPAPEPAAPPLGEISAVPQPCTLMELTNETCRWPIGEGADMLFCGSPSDMHNGRPYCQFHTRMGLAPRTTTRRPFIPMRKTA